MAGEDRHQLIATVAIVVVVVVAEFLGVLTTVFWSLDYLLLLHGKT